MSDHIPKEKRSWNMSRIRSKNTKPELIVRSILHRAGFRFRLFKKDLSGRPDIVLPKFKTVIFIHGCFWHRHQGCKRAAFPKTNTEYWSQKFQRNILKDEENINQLRTEGWRVIIIWECEVKNEQAILDKVLFLKKGHR